MKVKDYLKVKKEKKQFMNEATIVPSALNRIADIFYQDLVQEVGEYAMDKYADDEELQEKAGNLMLARIADLLKHRPH